MCRPKKTSETQNFSRIGGALKHLCWRRLLFFNFSQNIGFNFSFHRICAYLNKLALENFSRIVLRERGPPNTLFEHICWKKTFFFFFGFWLIVIFYPTLTRTGCPKQVSARFLDEITFLETLQTRCKIIVKTYLISGQYLTLHWVFTILTIFCISIELLNWKDERFIILLTNC